MSPDGEKVKRVFLGSATTALSSKIEALVTGENVQWMSLGIGRTY